MVLSFFFFFFLFFFFGSEIDESFVSLGLSSPVLVFSVCGLAFALSTGNADAAAFAFSSTSPPPLIISRLKSPFVSTRY